MHSTTRNILTLLLLTTFWIIPAEQGFGQEYDWTVVTVDAEFPHVSLLELRNDSLLIDYQGHTALFPIHSITEMRYRHGSEWYAGLLIGGILGGGIIRIAVPTARGDLAGLVDIATVATGIAGGALVGAVTGSFIRDEKVYDMRMLTTEAKVARIGDALRDTE